MSRDPNGWIQMVDGSAFWPLEARKEEVSIRNIAHALSNICRFGGHTKRFYSVGQHSVLVSYVCAREDALHGLLHDASEGLGLLDIPRPVKHAPALAGYREAEGRLEGVIALAFGLAETMPPSVKIADEILLATERRDLMSTPAIPWSKREQALKPMSAPIEPWAPERACAAFLDRFAELTGWRRGDWRTA